MNKDQTLRVRITIAERRALEAIAAKERLTVAETIRQIIRDEAKLSGCWPPAGIDKAAIGESTAARL